MDNFDWLKIDGHGLVVLHAVLRHGSMTAAAAQLDLNQSTVSHTIEKLRTALNDPLFVRAGRNVVPTDYLLTLSPRIEKLVADLQGLPKPEAFDPHAFDGRFTIVGNVTELLPELLVLRDQIGSAAPASRLRLLELGSRARISEVLSAPEVELLIAVKPTGYDPTIATEPLFTDTFSVFYDATRRDAPATVEEFCAARHAALDFGGNAPSVIDQLLQQKAMRRTKSFYAPNAYALGAFMKGTDLICTMQTRLKTSALAGLATAPVPFHLDGVRFDLVWHRRNEGNPRNIWLREQVRDVLRGKAASRVFTRPPRASSLQQMD